MPLAALAIAGCGGGGDDSTSTPTTTETTVALSKAELISQGDAICAEVNKAVGAAEIVTAEGGESELATKVSGLYIGMVESIKGLGAPEDAAGYPEFIAAADELSKTEGEVKLAAEREDTVALEEASGSASSARRRIRERGRRIRLRRLQRRTQRPDSERHRHRCRRRSRRRRRRSRP